MTIIIVVVCIVMVGCKDKKAADAGSDIVLDRTPLGAGTDVVRRSLAPALTFGLGDTEVGATWMKNSGVKWDGGRYRYLVMDSSGGWATNWCATCARDGRFAKRYLDESGAAGIMPVFTWYEILGLPGGGESEAYAKAKNAATMKTYFNDFKLLMQVCKNFGKPVIVHLEPDGYAQIQIAAGSNANAIAAVASTGLPELAGSPNTLIGWGQAFGRIRAAVGASNVILAPHYSTWSTGVDLMRGSGLTASIDEHVGRTAAFMRNLGLYEMLAVEWLDRDAQTRNIWWTTGDNDGLNTMSFNRNLAIFTALNKLTGKKLLLWQVPHGTSWSTIKSHHAEYVFGANGAKHREAMVAAGITSVLFGAGATGQTTHLTGKGPTGGLYLRDAVKALQSGTPTPVVDAGVPTVPTKKCVVRLHGKGGNGGTSYMVGDVMHLRPTGNSDGWGAKQWLYYPEANYTVVRDIVRKAVTDNKCTKVVLYGFSNGASAVAKMVCRDETLGGTLVGAVIDDPVADHGVEPCTPTAQRKLYATGSLAHAIDGWNCVTGGWTCEGGNTIGITRYAAALQTPRVQSPNTTHTPYSNAPELTSFFTTSPTPTPVPDAGPPDAGTCQVVCTEVCR